MKIAGLTNVSHAELEAVAIAAFESSGNLVSAAAGGGGNALSWSHLSPKFRLNWRVTAAKLIIEAMEQEQAIKEELLEFMTRAPTED